MTSHPGTFALRGAPQRDQVALDKWRATHRDKIPGWDPKADPITREGSDAKYDGSLAR